MTSYLLVVRHEKEVNKNRYKLSEIKNSLYIPFCFMNEICIIQIKDNYHYSITMANLKIS